MNKVDMVHKVYNYIKSTVPAVSLTLWGFIMTAYRDCEQSTMNKSWFIVLYVFLMLICGIVEGLNSYNIFVNNYPNDDSQTMKYYLCARICVSVSLYASITYYAGVPFNCFFNYNKHVALVLFIVALAGSIVMSKLEHRFWKKISITNAVLNLPM